MQNGISAVCGAIAGVAIVAIVVLTLVDVVLRTFFSVTLGWSVAFIEMYLLTVVAFFGLVTAYRSGAHVAVTSLFYRLGVRMRKVLLILAYLVLLIGMGALLAAGTEGLLFAIGIDEGPIRGSSELLIPGWVMRAILPASMVLGMIVVLIDLVRELIAPWHVTATDYDPGDTPEIPIATSHAGTDTAEGAR
ncbi:TRAP transporter small permease [Nocardia bhagyanarayanae]|uniref:TRAP transporter small permease n=1 Tax=Nocardia bhagyanarayanae TaxID=1215925 RepID=UPI001FE43128|nr:TRAP transporter small permease [Nocardia bhagyanarayanae]